VRLLLCVLRERMEGGREERRRGASAERGSTMQNFDDLGGLDWNNWLTWCFRAELEIEQRVDRSTGRRNLRRLLLRHRASGART
jgi:hypothetical protein